MIAFLGILGLVSLLGALGAAGYWALRDVPASRGWNTAVTTALLGGHALLALSCFVVLGISEQRGAAVGMRHKLMMSLFLFVTFLVYADVIAGMRWPRYPRNETPFESVPEAVWRMRANYVGGFSGSELHTNGDGHRSPEIAVEKPANTRRIVCLGDSLTFGHGVEERFSYPRALERRLNERFATAQWQVINTGVPGFCTFQETEELKRTLKYRPDAAIVLVCLNDITEKYLAHKKFGGTGLGYQGVADGTTGRLFHLMIKLRPYSALITRATPSRVQAERRQAYQIKNLWEQPDLPQIREAWLQAERELDELLALCRSEDVAMMIAVAPVTAQYSAGPVSDAPQERLREYARERGVAYLDLKSCIASHAARLGFVPEAMFQDQTHFTVNGNQAAAECVAGVMEEGEGAGDAALTAWRKRLVEGVR